MVNPLKPKKLLSNSIRTATIICILLVGRLLYAQSDKGIDFGFKIGLIVEYGSHVHRIGMIASTATQYASTQANVEFRGFYNFRSYGPKIKGLETVWSLGLAQGFGKPYHFAVPMIDSRFFSTDKKYTLGFTFQMYKDQMETSQGTGSFFFSADAFFLNFENDLFGNNKGKDRFRTGGFTLNYVHKNWILSLKNIIWTGETRCKEKVSYTDSDYPSRYGYHDVTKCKYGHFAHGIGALSATYLPEDWFGQHFSMAIGIDHEKIRHFFQNRLIHDMYFMPDGINPSRNLHYPMLDQNGNPYLFLKDQILKRPEFYFQFGANTHNLY